MGVLLLPRGPSAEATSGLPAARRRESDHSQGGGRPQGTRDAILQCCELLVSDIHIRPTVHSRPRLPPFLCPAATPPRPDGALHTDAAAGYADFDKYPRLTSMYGFISINTNM